MDYITLPTMDDNLLSVLFLIVKFGLSCASFVSTVKISPMFLLDRSRPSGEVRDRKDKDSRGDING